MCKTLIIGDLPDPGAFAGAQHDVGRDGAARMDEAGHAGLALRRKPGDGRLHELADRRRLRGRGPGRTLPAARLEREKIRQRGAHVRGCGGVPECDAAALGEPAALALELLAPLVAEHRLDIADALARGGEQRALVPADVDPASAALRQRLVERVRHRSVLHQA